MVQRIIKIFKSTRYLKEVAYSQRCFFSRKNGFNENGKYKIVNRGPDQDGQNKNLATHTNWELLAPEGFRFYLPGRIGPAWHDEISVSFIPTTISGFDGSELECSIQECPVVLRNADEVVSICDSDQNFIILPHRRVAMENTPLGFYCIGFYRSIPGLNELFPGCDTNGQQLTVVSLTQKKEKKATEADIEKLTKQFMWAAQDICDKLRKAGYWADFINPFSGMPFGNPSQYPPVNGIYQTDERFRCLGFQIMERKACRIISNKTSNKFIGSLFTNAPPSTVLLKDILKQYE